MLELVPSSGRSERAGNSHRHYRRPARCRWRLNFPPAAGSGAAGVPSQCREVPFQAMRRQFTKPSHWPFASDGWRQPTIYCKRRFVRHQCQPLLVWRWTLELPAFHCFRSGWLKSSSRAMLLPWPREWLGVVETRCCRTRPNIDSTHS